MSKIKGWDNRPQEIKDAEARLRKTVIETKETFKQIEIIMNEQNNEEEEA